MAVPDPYKAHSSETKATLYTGPYQSSIGFLTPKSSVFIGSDAIACYSSKNKTKPFKVHGWAEILSNFASKLPQA